MSNVWTERSTKVLIVEDDDDLRHLFRLALALAGFQVVESSDGVEALRQIDADPPDALVLDLMLPSLDGTALREAIAADQHTQRLPIVVVTGGTPNVGSLNVAAVLRKPITSELLVAAVKSALAQAKGQLLT